MGEGFQERNVASVQLMEKLRRGDRDAGTKLFDLWYRPVRNYLKRQGLDDWAAQDVLQDTFLTVMLKVTAFDTRKPFSSWLFTIAHHKAFNQRRKVNRRREFSSDSVSKAISSVGSSPSDILSSKEQRQAILDCVESLPEKLRSVITLRAYGGLSNQQIAGVLGLPVETIGSRLYRAKPLIVKCLENT